MAQPDVPAAAGLSSTTATGSRQGRRGKPQSMAAREQMGLMIRRIQNELTAVTTAPSLGLEKPYPKMLLALAKPHASLLHDAGTDRVGDPFSRSANTSAAADAFVKRIGSGTAGVFEKLQLRAAPGPSSGSPAATDAGGSHRMGRDSDSGHRLAALQSGEVDWCESISRSRAIA